MIKRISSGSCVALFRLKALACNIFHLLRSRVRVGPQTGVRGPSESYPYFPSYKLRYHLGTHSLIEALSYPVKIIILSTSRGKKSPIACYYLTTRNDGRFNKSSNTKFALRDPNGEPLTEAKAIARLKELQKSTENNSIQPTVIDNNRTNDSNLFPLLNESALKKHIASAASHCHYKEVIENIFLFEGTPNRYQIVVIGKDTKDFGKMKEYWDTAPERLFEDHFKEVYLKEPDYNIWADWGIIVMGSLDDMPDDFIVKKYKWHLYP